MKFPILVIETIVILGFLLIAGCIVAVALRPETGVGIVIMITSISGIATGTVLQLRATKANSEQLATVSHAVNRTEKQTDGMNSVLLAQLQVIVRHLTKDAPLNTGELETIRDNLVQAQVDIDRQKGIGQ